jgi:drug/metabolite transporter (DMT)-like permease
MIQRKLKAWQVSKNRSRNLAVFLIILVTAVWGLTFVTVKDAVERMPVMDFLACRFLLATALMVLFRPKSLFKLKWADRGKAALLGFILGMGYITQTFGLTLTTAAITGFITGMFVVFTPLIASLVLRKPIDRTAWTAVGFATIGLALISIRGFSIGYGELLALICALFYAIHIVGLGEWSKNRDPYAMAVIQLAVGAFICTVAALQGGFVMPPDSTAWWAVIITAVFATAIAFVVQTWAQSQISPTQIAVIMTMEPVFAGIFAVLIGGEHLGIRTLLGGTLVVIAMYLVELGPRKAREGEIAHLEI